MMLPVATLYDNGKGEEDVEKSGTSIREMKMKLDMDVDMRFQKWQKAKKEIACWVLILC